MKLSERAVFRASVAARSILRRLGLTPMLARLANKVRGRDGYEDVFSAALLASVRPGDRVWDVGANVGFYSIQLAERAGPSGHVFAFEPAPGCVEKLLVAANGLPNLTIMPLALSDHDGEATLFVSDNPTDVTHSLAAASAPPGAEGVPTQIRRADTIAAQSPTQAPNIVKIDVEGFEIDVVNGFGDVLRDPGLRAVFIEVHFGLLEARGKVWEVEKMKASLERAGMTCSWLDSSHLVAKRIQPA